MGFPPCFSPAPPVKNISQQHHYVKYAYTRAWCQKPSRNLPLRELTVFPPGRNSGFRHGRAPRRTAFRKMAPSGLGRYTLGILLVHPQAGLRCTNVHVFRFLGRRAQTGAYTPPQHTGYHGWSLRHIRLIHVVFCSVEVVHNPGVHTRSQPLVHLTDRPVRTRARGHRRPPSRGLRTPRKTR